LAHREFAGNIEVQIRQRNMGNGAYFNEAAVVMLDTYAFEVTAEGYYVNGVPTSLPTNVGSYSITSPQTNMNGLEIAEVSIGGYSLRFSSYTGGGNIHIQVGAVY